MNIMSALEDYIAEWRERPFTWQHTNCFHFGAWWVERVEGTNPMRGEPGPEGIREAVRMMRSRGMVVDVISHRLDRPAIDPKLAHVGDIVLFPCEGVNAVGICNGRKAFVLALGGGVAGEEMSGAIHAWRLYEAH